MTNEIDHTEFRKRYAPVAVIGGASAGIGLELARGIAARGLDVVLVARRGDALRALATEITSTYGVNAHVVQADLSTEAGVANVLHATRGVDVGLYIHNCAGHPGGEFHRIAVEDHVATIALNSVALVRLVHAYIPNMVERRSGGVVIIGTIGAMTGMPFHASYGSTKAYQSSLGEALWFELRRFGIDVLSYLVGATATPVYEDSAPQEVHIDEPTDEVGWLLAALSARLTRPDSPEAVAERCLLGLASGPTLFANDEDGMIIKRLLAADRSAGPSAFGEMIQNAWPLNPA